MGLATTGTAGGSRGSVRSVGGSAIGAERSSRTAGHEDRFSNTVTTIDPACSVSPTAPEDLTHTRRLRRVERTRPGRRSRTPDVGGYTSTCVKSRRRRRTGMSSNGPRPHEGITGRYDDPSPIVASERAIGGHAADVTVLARVTWRGSLSVTSRIVLGARLMPRALKRSSEELRFRGATLRSRAV